MKLWFILFHLGKIGGVWGPLPYDMAECQQRAADTIAEINERAAAKPEIGVKPGDYTAECRISGTRPSLEE
jgi:hypothetical protein